MKRTTLVLLLLAWGAIILATRISGSPSSASPPAAPLVERGKYLVTFGGCNDCHTPMKNGPHGPEPDMTRMLSGHPEQVKLPTPPVLTNQWMVACFPLTAWSGPWGITYATNLTPDEETGIGIWTEENFMKAMRTGKHFGVSRPILPPMPWQNLTHLTDEDLKAIFAYLRSIPSVRNRVPDPQTPSGSYE